MKQIIQIFLEGESPTLKQISSKTFKIKIAKITCKSTKLCNIKV